PTIKNQPFHNNKSPDMSRYEDNSSMTDLKLQQPSGEDGKSYRDIVYNRILRSRKTGVPTVVLSNELIEAFVQDYDTLLTNCRELESSHRIDVEKLQEYIQITDQVIELNEQTLKELEQRHQKISSALHDQRMKEIEHKQEMVDLMYRDLVQKESAKDKNMTDDEPNDLIIWDEHKEKGDGGWDKKSDEHDAIDAIDAMIVFTVSFMIPPCWIKNENTIY
ncbi:21311_t:CDS:2, partial [Racocetra persica]